jgi:2-dehydro-3-deoxyphosphooctonate aldolase (KDO 8-P synthase)
MQSVQSLQIQDLKIGENGPLVVIAGMCVIESEALLMETGEGLVLACEKAGLPLILKASFDKANRSAMDAFRGPGLKEGLAVLQRVKRALGVPITTDVHLPEQADAVAEVADLLQVPAFLCRQTDLLVACAKTGRPVNVKKGQFMAPWDMRHVVDKLHSSGCSQVMLTERGVSFGYNRLVCDIPGLAQMRGLGTPVCFDATHSVQQPGALQGGSGGDASAAPALARAAVAAGVDAVFFECHPQPALARSDAATALSLAQVGALLEQLSAIDGLLRER